MGENTIELAGLVLAAGSGSRRGQPKALGVADDGTPWVARAASFLRAAGAAPVLFALGAEADEAKGLLPEWSQPLVVRAWKEGVGASLRESLIVLDQLPDTVNAVLITLVDLPSADVAAARRVLGAGWSQTALRRATYAGAPGHPVLIGRSHWQSLVNQLRGDTGAQSYLATNNVDGINCTDIGGGDDVDYLPTRGAGRTSTQKARPARTKSVGSPYYNTSGARSGELYGGRDTPGEQ